VDRNRLIADQDPDPAFYSNADPDPDTAFHSNADPDPETASLHRDGNLRTLV
jgi:hypothetical protein